MKNIFWLILIISLTLTLPSGFLYAEEEAVAKLAKISEETETTTTKTTLQFDESKADAAAEEAASELTKLLNGKPANVTEQVIPVVEEKVVSEIWTLYPPLVKVSPFGTEIKINVNFDPKMEKEKLAAVQSVKLETDKGEFLGLKTYSPDETSREAEFMVNPEALKIDAVKITIVSSTDGEFSTPASLVIVAEEPKVESSPAVEGDQPSDSAVVAPAATKEPAGAPAAEAKPAPKKKGWSW